MDAAEHLSAANAAEVLLTRFPFLHEPVMRLAEEEGVRRDNLADLGLHLLFGDVFNPYLLIILQSGVSPQEIGDAFAFLEALATSDDDRLTEVAAVTVCERLGDDDDVLRQAVKWGSTDAFVGG